MKQLTELERSIMRAVAQADRERETMEVQVDAAQVLSREHTGVGFYTNLEVSDSIAKLDEGRWKIEDMGHGFAHHPELPGGASFILWIKGGRIVCLEGVTNGGNWPKNEMEFRVAV
jgi:hypothetical protein